MTNYEIEIRSIISTLNEILTDKFINGKDNDDEYEYFSKLVDYLTDMLRIQKEEDNQRADEVSNLLKKMLKGENK